MNILFAASEARPYAASGGLADVIGSLPVELNDMGHKCCVVMPLYKNMKQELREELQYVTDMTIEIGWRKQYCEVFKGVYKNVTYYLVDSQYYFGRDGLYGFYDDAERFIFFSRAVIELISKINFKPDIINANDWQTAMIPVYLKTVYQFREEYENIKTVFTIHNIQYQGIFGLDIINELMGISSYLICCNKTDKKFKKRACFFYLAQLLVNTLWSLFFFRLGWLTFALLWLLLLIVLVAIMIVNFYKLKPLAAYLQIPYILWLLIAGILNISIILLN